VCAIYMGLVQTLLIGGLLYLAALAVVARAPKREADAPKSPVALAQAPLH